MYRDLKIAASDGACLLLTPITPESFSRYCTRFVDGFFVTIELMALACLIGFVIAVGVAFARVSDRRLVSVPAFVFCYIFRGTPLLVQLWIIYFGVGGLGEAGLGSTLWIVFKDGWNIGLIVLTLNTSAYVAEILRGGLVNVPKGQLEAAAAIGLSWWRTMVRIRLPQAVRTAWPAYGNEVILLMKGSALVSTITVLDLMGQTRTVFSRTYGLEIFLYAAVFYVIIALILTLILRGIQKIWLEQTTARS